MQRRSHTCERSPQQGLLLGQSRMTTRLRRRCQTWIIIKTTQRTISHPDTLKIQIKRRGVVVDIIGNNYQSLVDVDEGGPKVPTGEILSGILESRQQQSPNWVSAGLRTLSPLR